MSLVEKPDVPAHALSELLERDMEALAAEIVEQHYRADPTLAPRYGEPGRKKCLQDARYHLAYLSQALNSGRPGLFSDYIVWAQAMLAARGIPRADLEKNLAVLKDCIVARYPGAEDVATTYFDQALQRLDGGLEVASFIPPAEPLDGTVRRYLDSLLKTDRAGAGRIVTEALDGGMPMEDLYLSVFQRSQREVGRLWQLGKISVGQEHYCTAATQMIMSQLYPRLFATPKNGKRMLATCVSGDLHEIGVRMIADFFEMKGWDSCYLGANTPMDSVLKMAVQHRADFVAISATISFNIRAVTQLIAALRRTPECRSAKILVGGYPFNIEPTLWQSVGADLFARDAREAIDIASAG